jgi:uncharacterized membrane protein YczE
MMNSSETCVDRVACEARRTPAWRAFPWLRSTQLLGGVFLYGVAHTFMIRAQLGYGPWDAFHVGFGLVTGMTVGWAMVLWGLIYLLATWALGTRPGIGTVVNMALLGVFVDLTLPLLPDAGNVWIGLGYGFIGLAMVGLATGMYIGARMGKGPRDGFVVTISARNGWQVKHVATAVLVANTVAGWAMGAELGIGTLMFALLTGPAAQRGLMLFGFSATGVDTRR